jgi:3-oxoacyl-[acyl-carrier protein] reductase
MSRFSISLTNRTVIVAGAGGGGIGSAIAGALLEVGAAVVAVDIQEGALQSLAADTAGNPRLVPVLADVREQSGVQAIMDAVHRVPGSRPFGLVNVVGSQNLDDFVPLLNETRQNWSRVFSLNLDYIPFLCAALVAELRAGGVPGSIVNLATISAFGGAPNHAGHGASKAALISLTQSMADEWGALAVRVNVIAPGAIDVPHFLSTPTTAPFTKQVIPLGRRGAPVDIANMALFLLSDLSSYVTGQWIGVDGGLNTRLAFIGGDNLPVFIDDPGIRSRCAPPSISVSEEP